MRDAIDSVRVVDIRVVGGTLTLNRRVVDLLGLVAGDVVMLCEAGGEWYLYKRTAASEVVGRQATLRVHSVRLCDVIRRVVGVSAGEPLGLLCGDVVERGGRRCLVVIMRRRMSVFQQFSSYKS